MFVFKLIQEGIPGWVLTLPRVGELQRRFTRQANDFVIARTRTKLAENSLKVRGPKTWNNLPESLKSINIQSIFKKQLRKNITP